MVEIISTSITALIAFIAGLMVNIQGRFQFFSTTVSQERMIWIKDIRSLCTELCSICEMYDVDTLPDTEKMNFLKARNGILIRLDPKGWYITDDELIDLLKEPDFSTVKQNVPRIREILRRIEKGEWDKVKIEAGNSASKVKRIEAIQAKLNDEYYHGNQ